MTTRLGLLWDRLRTSYWFLPSLMATTAVALALGMVALDRSIERTISLWGVYRAEPDGAREILACIAGSTITVAGVVFSITIVTLTLASSQFGPRLLRNYIRDRGNQFVLGTFLSSFLYCIVVLREVNSVGKAFVPQLAVTLAILLAVLNVGVLIYYIHHIAISIQASHVIASVGSELVHTIHALFPSPKSDANGSESPVKFEPPEGTTAHEVKSAVHGYIIAFDLDHLLQFALEHDLVIELKHKPGHFVVEGDTLARVWGSDSQNESVESRIRNAVLLADQRTALQDIEFTIDQLTEIAARALSPGINDPYTALICIDHLGRGLVHLARVEMPSPYRQGSDAEVRLITYPLTFADVVDAALHPLRQYGRTHACILIRLLEMLEKVAGHVTHEKAHEVLLQHAILIHRAGEGLPEDVDRQELADRYGKVLDIIGCSQPRPNGDAFHVSGKEQYPVCS